MKPILANSVFKIYIFIVFLISLDAWAIELVCKGDDRQNPQQRAIYVDCNNRKAVIDILGSAWTTLRRERIGGDTEDLCWRPYKEAKDLPPSIPFDGIAQTFFMQCNMALEYVK